MKRIMRIAFVAVAVISLANCKKPTEFKEIEVDNIFSMQIPAYFHSTTDLFPNTAANIHQYDDSAGKVFLMIYDTSRADFDISSLRTFYDSMVANSVMDSTRILEPQLVKIDNDSAYRSEITGKQGGTRLFGEMAAIASKNRFYFILTWTDLNKRDDLKPDMYKMLNSFHDISNLKK